jgi:hypothetical protein
MTRWIIPVVVVAAAAIGVIVAVAAGGSDSETEASAAGADSEAMSAFRDCMSEHGAEVPEGPAVVRPPGTDSPPSGDRGEIPPARGELTEPDAETQEALEACADLMPQSSGGGTFFGPGAPPGAAPIPQD